ncbi:hypothetical protein [Flavobacterium sp. MK4S-17]|uniref:hypothetical protein n=1 Tax=Flavobacterium sp. MK4S-17 TaxID=2543737 RepID=UPI001359960A|nr:hypothetical protein [Flavobacterium sp. MK4S-17]
MEFDKEKYKVLNWKNIAMLHWIINPGLAFNELVLGQRVPKISLIEISTDKPLYERSFIPCPHCNTIHDGRIWSVQNNTAFKNWFGLYCPTCSNVIPCFTNIFSFIILAVTFPVWGWFRKQLKNAWLKKQPARYRDAGISLPQNPYNKKGWIKEGLTWGTIMFILMEILLPAIEDEEIGWRNFAVGIPIWLLGGLLFGYSMKRFFAAKLKNN